MSETDAEQQPPRTTEEDGGPNSTSIKRENRRGGTGNTRYQPRNLSASAKRWGIISSSTTEEDSLVSLVAVEYLIHVWISTNKSMIHQGKRVPHRVSVTTSCD